jgi:hypothetical protein
MALVKAWKDTRLAVFSFRPPDGGEFDSSLPPNAPDWLGCRPERSGDPPSPPPAPPPPPPAPSAPPVAPLKVLLAAKEAAMATGRSSYSLGRSLPIKCLGRRRGK